MELSIRPATRLDYPSICEIFAEGETFHAAALPDVFRVGDGPIHTEEFVFQAIEDEDVTLLVADEGGEVVGVVHVVVRRSPDFSSLVPRCYANVESLVVGAGFRRRGIGRALMEEAHHWAAGKGLPGIELTVWEFNKGAIALYEELGYTTAHRKMWRSTSL